MTHLIGRRNPREGYPLPGKSALASMPFVQLGVSEAVPYTPGGILELIPFDTIVYQTSEFGEFGNVPGVGDVFRLPFGVYLGVLQIGTTAEDVTFSAALGITSSSAADQAVNGSDVSGVSVTVSAVRFATETPLPGGDLPCCAIPSFLPPAAGDPGTLAVILTKMFIWQLARF